MAVDLQRFFHFDPGEDASWHARRRLAAAGRVLSDRCVDAESDEAALSAAAALVEQAVALLNPGKTPGQAYADGSFHEDPAVYMDRSAMFGVSNPVAPPMLIRWEDARSVCDMRFGWRHGGAPGIVHGGLIAAALDQVSGHCATLAERGGLTVQLDVTYRKAVPVGVPLTVAAWVTAQDDRTTTIHAEVRGGDVVYAESRGVFRLMKREHIARVLTSADG
ncbi:MAG: PaaI family thioesterase [Deltaproteobacteria bacterium]|nr:MAG: PaaI family thioesterase [Deltaproteobacteria bacterium]